MYILYIKEKENRYLKKFKIEILISVLEHIALKRPHGFVQEFPKHCTQNTLKGHSRVPKALHSSALKGHSSALQSLALKHP